MQWIFQILNFISLWYSNCNLVLTHDHRPKSVWKWWLVETIIPGISGTANKAKNTLIDFWIMISWCLWLTNNDKNKWERMKVKLSITDIDVECWFNCVLPLSEIKLLFLEFLDVEIPQLSPRFSKKHTLYSFFSRVCQSTTFKLSIVSNQTWSMGNWFKMGKVS